MLIVPETGELSKQGQIIIRCVGARQAITGL